MDAVLRLKQQYDDLWESRDKRMDGLPLMGSPIYTILICATYVYIVKVAGPKFMKNREPYNLRTFLIVYNFLQVALSGYIVYRVRCRLAEKKSICTRCSFAEKNQKSSLSLQYCSFS